MIKLSGQEYDAFYQKALRSNFKQVTQKEFYDHIFSCGDVIIDHHTDEFKMRHSGHVVGMAIDREAYPDEKDYTATDYFIPKHATS